MTLLLLSLAVTSLPPDAVLSLPTYGAIKGTQYAGFANGTADGKNKLFYWFAECDCGNAPDVPFLLWLNGGPGASSLTGFLLEKLGPLSVTLNSTLVDNPDRLTKNYHVLVFDNPVGSGFSYSAAEPPAYVTSEYEMRTQLLRALRGFFAMHPEYKANPFWVTGESYAGHYVPNIAWEIAVNATEIPIQGVAIGNGMYNMKLQYNTVGAMAFASGVIDEQVYAQEQAREASCLAMIDASPATAVRCVLPSEQEYRVPWAPLLSTAHRLSDAVFSFMPLRCLIHRACTARTRPCTGSTRRTGQVAKYSTTMSALRTAPSLIL